LVLAERKLGVPAAAAFAAARNAGCTWAVADVIQPLANTATNRARKILTRVWLSISFLPCRARLLHYRDRNVSEVYELTLQRDAWIGLRNESALRVVVEHRVALAVGFADPLADRIYLVGCGADSAGRLNHPPARI